VRFSCYKSWSCEFDVFESVYGIAYRPANDNSRDSFSFLVELLIGGVRPKRRPDRLFGRARAQEGVKKVWTYGGMVRNPVWRACRVRGFELLTSRNSAELVGQIGSLPGRRES